MRFEAVRTPTLAGQKSSTADKHLDIGGRELGFMAPKPTTQKPAACTPTPSEVSA